MEVNEPAVKYATLKGMNPLEYIEWESTQPDKNEYIAGSIYAMAGASINHNTIQSNLIGTIHPFLKGRIAIYMAATCGFLLNQKKLSSTLMQPLCVVK